VDKIDAHIPAVKPTVNDIARVAGVSLATVDRVLNGRSGVRARTIEKVNDAISQLGYVRDTAAASLARRRFYRLRFILPETAPEKANEFVVALRAELALQHTQQRHQRVSLETVSTPPFDVNAVVAALDAVDPSAVDGVAVFGPETPSIRDAVRRAKERGLAVVALVSDLPDAPLDHYVGIDNAAAGRTAAELMGRFVRQPGKVLVVTGSRLARDHLERRSGFDAVIGREYPDLAVLASLEGRDDPDLIRAMLPEIFARHGTIRGIYSSGAGNLGVIDYLETSGLAREVLFVAHELTATSRAALERGTIDAILSQDTGHLVRSAIRLLKARVDATPVDLRQERIRIDIYLRGNVPPRPVADPGPSDTKRETIT
jgi:LacI family transcriptional regulator